MKTKREAVEGKVNIWAIPRSEYQIEESDDGLPFRLELDTSNYVYTTGAVKIDSQKITVYSPEGIDLVDAALETLRAEKVKKKEAFEEDIAILDEQIHNLLRLEHITEEA